MNKCFILVVEEKIKNFTMVGSGVDCKFNFAVKGQTSPFDKLEAGDHIVGYVASDKKQFVYLFDVISVANEKECILNKIYEVCNGLPLELAPDDVKIAIGTAEQTDSFIEIKNVTYCELVKRMLNESEIAMCTTLGISDNNEQPTLCYNTKFSSEKPRNRIVFGAPGTGKSFMINEDRKELLGDDNEIDYERVTFHPDYSYANFVGTYKPVPCKDSEGKDAITYEYVPGPFMRMYVNALKSGMTNNPKPYLLIIEEINRANVAAVFGDVFQLLDRDENGVSEYPIQASEDIKKYLAKELGGNPSDYSKIKIPNNMFIWATMNSADQGVFPMDTAFKRRWDFKYIGIDDNDKDIQDKYVILGSNTSQKVEWNKLRKAINNFLTKQKINEDKQLGPYFISRKIVVPENGNEIDRKAFSETFKNKVLMYLFEDAAKQKRPTLFEGCFANSNRYSEICKEFDEKGLGIFNHDISLESEPEDLTIEGATATTTPENIKQ